MKHAKYILLLALCLVLTACGPKENTPAAASSVPDVSQSEPNVPAPDVSQPEPDVSEPDVSAPDSSEPVEDPLPPLTEADKAAAYDAACDYYLGTVFEVHSLTEIGTRTGEITFQVSCSKGGVKQDPDRTISLERQGDAWAVVSEGY